MPKNVLIATLGESPIVVTSMVQALQTKKGMKIDQLYVIHPPNNERYITDAYQLVADHLEGQCVVSPCPLGCSDTNSIEASMEFLQVLSDLIQSHEHERNNVYLSLAGGRKNMSALMAVTCQFFSCVQGLYHILDQHENSSTPNFYSTEDMWLKYDKTARRDMLSPPAQDLILVEIPYPQLSNDVALLGHFSRTQSNPNAPIPVEIKEVLDPFYREIFQKKKTNLFDVYLSEETHNFYEKNGSDRQRLRSYFRSMRDPCALSHHKHDFKGDRTKTDCTCFKKARTQLRLFYYQNESKVVVATITGHRTEQQYKNIINGRQQLYSRNHPAHIHSNKLEEDSILIAPLGKSPMVVTQTFALLSKREGANIEKVIVVHPQNSEISNGVEVLEYAFKKKHVDFNAVPIDTQDVASHNDCKIYLKTLVDVINKAQIDNPDKSIYLSLSGGRKGMAALTLFAAQQANIDAVYHTLITDVNHEKKIEEETTLTALQNLSRKKKAQRLFLDDYEESKFELFRVPVIPISINSAAPPASSTANEE